LGAGDDATGAACLGGDELTTAGADDLGGGEAGLGWRRRRGFKGEAAKAPRCMVLARASWDLRTAVAMAKPNPNERERIGDLWEGGGENNGSISGRPRAALYRIGTGDGSVRGALTLNNNNQ
jgi:hypothetical protein